MSRFSIPKVVELHSPLSTGFQAHSSSSEAARWLHARTKEDKPQLLILQLLIACSDKNGESQIRVLTWAPFNRLGKAVTVLTLPGVLGGGGGLRLGGGCCPLLATSLLLPIEL